VILAGCAYNCIIRYKYGEWTASIVVVFDFLDMEVLSLKVASGCVKMFIRAFVLQLLR